MCIGGGRGTLGYESEHQERGAVVAGPVGGGSWIRAPVGWLRGLEANANGKPPAGGAESLVEGAGHSGAVAGGIRPSLQRHRVVVFPGTVPIAVGEEGAWVARMWSSVCGARRGHEGSGSAGVSL